MKKCFMCITCTVKGLNSILIISALERHVLLKSFELLHVVLIDYNTNFTLKTSFNFNDLITFNDVILLIWIHEQYICLIHDSHFGTTLLSHRDILFYIQILFIRGIVSIIVSYINVVLNQTDTYESKNKIPIIDEALCL